MRGEKLYAVVPPHNIHKGELWNYRSNFSERLGHPVCLLACMCVCVSKRKSQNAQHTDFLTIINLMDLKESILKQALWGQDVFCCLSIDQAAPER